MHTLIINIILIVLALALIFAMEASPKVRLYAHQEEKKKTRSSGPQAVEIKPAHGGMASLISDFEHQADAIQLATQRQYEKGKNELFQELRYEIGWLALMIDESAHTPEAHDKKS
jgi:NADH:ubiquinone oxidoreductase subunit 3 (subunit A)